MTAPAFTLRAPAKINLFLHITGRRDDGYHTLQSLLTFADVGDELEFIAADDFSFTVQGPFAEGLSTGPDNLVCKAAQQLAAAYHVPLRGRIVLTKNLPVAAGIGGGSSDAAAALKGLMKLWDVRPPLQELFLIAQKLGADVPACLVARSVFAEGIGEHLTPAAAPHLHLVLANPGIATPTAAVFRNLSGFSRPEDRQSLYTLEDIRLRHNDLTAPAEQVTPAIIDVLVALGKTEGCLLHRLSGSGATCFGVYGSAVQAQAAAQALRARHPAWWVVAAQTV